MYYVYTATHSPLDVAFVAIAGLVPNLLMAIVSGAIADRVERRRVMVLSDVVRAVSWASIATIVLLLGAVAVASVFTTLFYPAERALLPEIVGAESVPEANAILLSTNQIVGFLAYAVGGILVAAVGVVAGLYYNAGTFVVSALLVVSIVVARPTSTAQTLASEPFLTSVRQGFAYLRREVGLLELTLNAMFQNFFFNIVLAFVVVYAVSLLGSGATTYGLLLGAFSLGSAGGAFLALRTGAVRRMGLAWTVSGLAAAAPIAALVLVPNIGSAAAAYAAIGILTGYGGTAWLSGAQLLVPRAMQGRYFGVDQLGSIAILPVAQIVGSALIGSIGIAATYGIMAIGLTATGAVSLLFRDLRRLAPGPRAIGGSPPPSSAES